MFLDSRDIIDKCLESNNLQTHGSEPSIDLRVTRNTANDVFVKMMERWFQMHVSETMDNYLRLPFIIDKCGALSITEIPFCLQVLNAKYFLDAEVFHLKEGQISEVSRVLIVVPCCALVRVFGRGWFAIYGNLTILSWMANVFVSFMWKEWWNIFRCIDWMEVAMGLVDKKAFEDFVTTFWNIWNSRNNALFWVKDEDAIVIWDRAKTLTSEFRIHNLTHEPMIPKTHCTQNWEKPPNGFTKVNIVAVVVDNMIVFGVIMRDCDNFVLGGITV
ncbi:hypothetical protein Golob_015240 [Gossypium lobatum]|uniref:Uncharacterized protein n=1 Tax=Gossypium lobatum TaxID=34289 RepID=A0A7J8M124_9ROSI|nr:hypothetical protein [Gossypium lobatum]